MADPVLIAVATALAGKAAGAIASGGAAALRSLLDLVKAKFAGRPDAEQALQAAHDEPQRTENVDRLAAALEEVAAADPEFGEQLRSLWDRASAELHADHGGVINEVSGTVGGNVVQARDVAGSISFGNTPRQGA
jgi:hypothetical protein